jgi:hypothetical protein
MTGRWTRCALLRCYPIPRVSVCLFMINYTHHSRHLPRAGQPGCHALHWRAGNLWDGPFAGQICGIMPRHGGYTWPSSATGVRTGPYDDQHGV